MQHVMFLEPLQDAPLHRQVVRRVVDHVVDDVGDDESGEQHVDPLRRAAPTWCATWPSGLVDHAPFWKLAQTLFEVLPRDETADVCRDKDGNPEPDPELRDIENVPLKEDIHEYFAREVLPHVPDAWIDEGKTKVGYEILFNRHFYTYTPPRPLAEIEADIKAIEQGILAMLREVAK